MNGRAEPGHFVGVEIGVEVIRAGVYSDLLIPVGKAKRSTKLERGTAAVIERIVRCIRDAVDEADLAMGGIRAVGLAVPGLVAGTEPAQVSCPGLLWSSVHFEAELESRLGVACRPDDYFRLSTYAAYVIDSRRRQGRVAALFWDTRLGAGLVENGVLANPSAPGNLRQWLERQQPQWEKLLPEPFRHWQGRDLRKALKRGDETARSFVRVGAVLAGEALAEMAREMQPDAVVIGGAVIEERKAETLAILTNSARAHLADRWPLPEIIVSELGDSAALTGAAAWARDHLSAEIRRR